MSHSISSVRAQHVATPKWRITDPLEQRDDDSDASDDQHNHEDVRAETYVDRHELYELKERYATLYKKLEKESKEKLKLQQHSANSSDQKKPDLEQFRTLVLALESDKRMLHHVCQLSASLPASLLAKYMDGAGAEDKKPRRLKQKENVNSKWKSTFLDWHNNKRLLNSLAKITN